MLFKHPSYSVAIESHVNKVIANFFNVRNLCHVKIVDDAFCTGLAWFDFSCLRTKIFLINSLE